MLDIRLVDGKPVGLGGHADHPIGRGALCPQGCAVLQEVFHPDRLRYPLARKSRGSAGWERISWGEARNLLRFKLETLLERRRPEALAVLAGPRKDLRRGILQRFAENFGTPHFWKWDWTPAQPPKDAFKRMHGFSKGIFYDLSNAGLLVSFGWDWLQAFPSPVEAQRAFGRLRGGRRSRIIQIEPRLSISAAKSDEWIGARGGSEGAVALAVAHVMIREGLYDRDFVGGRTEGFEAYRKIVDEYSPARSARLAGIPEERIVALAREMAGSKPSLAVTSRTTVFDQIAVHSLNVLTGSIGVPGGVLAVQDPSSAPPASFLSRGAGGKGAASIVSWEQIPEAALSGRESPIGVLWVDGVNPAFSSPQPSQWRAALERIPFIVSFSPIMSETSEFADLVLPTHEALEAPQDASLVDAEGRRVDSFVPAVMPSLYDTADLGDFVLELARDIGGRVSRGLPWKNYGEALGDHAAKRGWKQGMLVGGGWSSAPSPVLALGRKKCRMSHEELARPDVAIEEPGRGLDLHVQFPLAFFQAEGAQLPYLHGLNGIRGAKLGDGWETTVDLHPETARRLQIEDGSAVWVESDAGRIQARARVCEGVREDTISMPVGLGHTAMGRYAKGVGSNPADIIPREFSFAGRALWRAQGVKVYAV
jgi:anaerobic selenocysteine-containing dehydrogenase